MPSPFVKTSFSFSIIVIILGNVSAFLPGYSYKTMQSPALLSLGNGYKCNNVIFPPEFLRKVIGDIKQDISYSWIPIYFRARKRLSFKYDGPPFMKSYLHWPISLETRSYDEAMSGPYRAVISDSLEVFSVVSSREEGVEECILIEEVSEEHVKHTFRCLRDTFTFHQIQPAVQIACQKILVVATQTFPARYNGSQFAHLGEQRYIYPIKIREAYRDESDPGPHRLVMNSACKLVGVITKYQNGEVGECYDLGPSDELSIQG